jgi:hypothetical protein
MLFGLLENLGTENGDMDQEKMEQEPQYLYSQQSLDRSLNHAVCSDTVQPTSDRQGNILCLYGT